MYDKKVIEEYGEDPSTHPQFDAKLWEEVIGPNRHGDCYGQGVLGKLRVSSEGSDAASGAMPMQISEVELDDVAKRVTDKLLERMSCDDSMTQRVMDRVMERLNSDAISKILDKKIGKKVEKVKKNLEKKYKKKEKKILKKALRQSLASRDSQAEVILSAYSSFI